MREKLRTLLGIESGEESMVSMLLTQSIFLGIFIGAFDITAHSLFLSVFDEKMMARGYVVSGVAGLILIYLYPRLNNRIKFGNFSSLNLIVLAVITLVIWTWFIITPSELLLFIMFILIGPFNLLALPGFWRTTDHFFTTKQGKRMFLPADVGLIAGILIISFAIPVLLNLNFPTKHILLISSFSVLVAALFRIRIVKKIDRIDTDELRLNGDYEKNKHVSFRFLNDPYFRVIGVYVALSVLATFFIQYLFMAVVRQQYPAADEMAIFLGLFTGILMILILFLRLVIFTHFLLNYGMRTCLLISPVLIAVFTFISILIALLIGYTSESASGFVLFFLLVAAIKLISKSLKDSVEIRSIKVIFQSVDRKTKSDLKQNTAGTINEVMVIFSGLILTGLGLFSFFKLIHFSILLFVITVIWIFVAIRLYKEYRKRILKVTWQEEQKDKSSDDPIREDRFKNKFSGWLTFRTDYYNLITGEFSVLNKTENRWYFENLIDYAALKNDFSLIPALKRLVDNKSLDDVVRNRSAVLHEELQKLSNSVVTDNGIISEAIRNLSGTRLPQTTEILKLLRENSFESKRLAIYMIGKFRLSDLLVEVCECLNSPGLSTDAYEVLKSFGKDAEEGLISCYLKTSGNQKLSGIILRLLEKNCTNESTGFLYSRLWSNSRQLKEIAVKCLITSGYKPTEDEKQRLNQLISDVIGAITWNLSAKVSMGREHNDLLIKRFDLEIYRWNEFLLNLLSITYNPDIVARIKENLRRETLESVSYALEIADAIVSDTIKPQIISLLELVPDEVKLNNLLQFFPGQMQEPQKLLEDIINCDYNLISLWTKACALRSIVRIEGENLAESVTALLFSPEDVIQEESANLIARSDHELYISANERIPYSTRKRLDNIVNGTTDKRELLFEKIQFLSKCFGKIPEDDLLLLAREMKFINNFDTETLKNTEESVIWLLNNDNEPDEVHVLKSGRTPNVNNEYKRRQGVSIYKIALNAVEEFHFQSPDISWKILKYIDNNEE
jgi:ATP/ADP translocase